MVYRDRQALSTSTGDPNQSTKIRDRYLDNCFLLCINRDETTDLPEIHRLENHLMKDLCRRSQSESQRLQTSEYFDENENDDNDDEYDEEEFFSPRQRRNQDYSYRKRDHQIDRNVHLKSNHSRYQRDDDFVNQDRYSRISRRNHRPDFNNLIQQNNDDDDDDDQLSVYEIYVPTNTLNRLSDKRIDNNMVLVDYEDVSALQSMRGPFAQNMPRQYSNYRPMNQYNDYTAPYPYDLPASFTRERDYQNNPLQQQQQQQSRFNGYYSNETAQTPFAPQAGPYFPPNPALDPSNAINIRRHLYSPSQLPQGLTEGQLAMLLQKGSQYQQMKYEPTVPTQTQLFPTSQASQLSTSSALNASTTPSPMPSAQIEPFKNAEYTSVTQIKVPQTAPQIVGHRVVDDDQNSTVDGATKIPARNSLKESKDNDEKKKEKKEKKEKKSEKDEDDGGGKKDSKKEKSSEKEGKKKKK